ncbi:RNA-directed DNA polymerase [Conexibacter sp. SYSU D00693]|uniref:RNA-directed DNA polymerase n=1 Tax=Conexibacter sp. SYSU D00693 TaxID=2812560 RepID=UPI00196AD4F3|nr:RNA-directed DNA polymerase [Conexibacter sp. SYSU D00693]
MALATATPTALSNAAGDLFEDVLGAWAPDVAAWADIETLLSDPGNVGSYAALPITVPGVGGASFVARMLHPALHARMHATVAPLRDTVDAALAKTVFGYRRGAEKGHRYADDWRAFSQFVAERADSSSHLLLTDVKSFFGSTPWTTVERCLRSFIGVEVPALSDLGQTMHSVGVTTLPTGYSDARFLANIVLAVAESGVGTTYARWVDDYRFFVDGQAEAQAVLAALDQGLYKVGLRRNLDKTRLLLSHDAVERHHRTLASVYHPERDPDEVVAARLHSVLETALLDPIANRRQLRFVLPRLAAEHDSIAVHSALNLLEHAPWEAPRLTAYLAEFATHEEVGLGANASLRAAALAGDSWLVSRLVPLVIRSTVEPATLRLLHAAMPALRGTPAWGLALRLLSLHGCGSEFITDDAEDGRAVVAAARDLQTPIPSRIARAEGPLVRATDHRPAPLPRVDTLL